MSEIIHLSGVVLSFPALIEAKASTDGGIPKFSADLICAPNDPGFQKFMQQVALTAQAKWGEHANAVLQMIQQDRKMRCYGSGAEKIDKKTFKPYVGYEGNVFISGNNSSQPQMIQPDGSLADPANTMLCQALARKLYGGCKVNVAVKPWPQENKHGRGMRCELIAVQFAADGTPFGDVTPDVSGMFGQVAAPVGASPAGMAAPAFPAFGFQAPAAGLPPLPAFAPAAPAALPAFAPAAPAAPAFPAFQMPSFLG